MEKFKCVECGENTVDEEDDICQQCADEYEDTQEDDE